MSGLPNLIRLHKWKLEETRRKLAEMEGLARSLTEQIRAIGERAAAESRLVQDAPEVAPALGGFVQAGLLQREKLGASLAAVEQEIAGLRARVTDSFRELKRYELTDAQRRDRARKVVKRRERIGEDEIGMEIFRRKDGAKGN